MSAELKLEEIRDRIREATVSLGISKEAMQPVPPAPMPPQGGMPMDPNMGGMMPPQGGMPMDPNMGGMMPPQGLQQDPQTGLLVDPATGAMYDPQTMQPVDPSMMAGGAPAPPAPGGGGAPGESMPPELMELLEEVVGRVEDFSKRQDDLEAEVERLKRAVNSPV